MLEMESSALPQRRRVTSMQDNTLDAVLEKRHVEVDQQSSGTSTHEPRFFIANSANGQIARINLIWVTIRSRQEITYPFGLPFCSLAASLLNYRTKAMRIRRSLPGNKIAKPTDQLISCRLLTRSSETNIPATKGMNRQYRRCP